jgi:hypothetical protein
VWTDSLLSIASAGCSRLVLVQAKNKRERSMPVRPPSVEQTSRFGSWDLVASGVKCGSHGVKNNKMMSCMVSWLVLKTKVESGQCGSRVMSGDWWRDTKFAGFAMVHHKTIRLLG